MALRTIILLSLLSVALSDDKKWAWDTNGREGESRAGFRPSNDYLSKRPLSKYEISEFIEGASTHLQIRPSDFRPPSDYDRPYRPEYNRPSHIAGNRPGDFGVSGGGGLYNQDNFGPNGYGQGGSGILTGPVPSWQKEPTVQDFDKCKCTEKFNCNSPGISYGHCDVGKQYCCYNSRGNAGGPVPSRPVHSIENGILAGPGGPVDHIPGGPGLRPPPAGFRPHHRPGYNDYNNGILAGPPGPLTLVGPGGPTGIIGRPTGHNGPRPINNYHTPDLGVLVGPGGPYDRPYGGFGGGYRPNGFGLGRSAKQDDKEEKKN